MSEAVENIAVSGTAGVRLTRTGKIILAFTLVFSIIFLTIGIVILASPTVEKHYASYNYGYEYYTDYGTEFEISFYNQSNSETYFYFSCVSDIYLEDIYGNRKDLYYTMGATYKDSLSFQGVFKADLLYYTDYKLCFKATGSNVHLYISNSAP